MKDKPQRTPMAQIKIKRHTTGTEAQRKALKNKEKGGRGE